MTKLIATLREMFAGLTWSSLVHFKDEPALWGGFTMALYQGWADASNAGLDGGTAARLAVTAGIAFIVRGAVSPAYRAKEVQQ